RDRRRPAEPDGPAARGGRVQPARGIPPPAVPVRLSDRARPAADRRGALPAAGSGRTLAGPRPGRATGGRALATPPPAAPAVGIFGVLIAAAGVDLDVDERTLVGISGPNGAGKTTFFNPLPGLVTPASGRLLVGGVDLTAKPAHLFARAGIARTFQTPRVFA